MGARKTVPTTSAFRSGFRFGMRDAAGETPHGLARLLRYYRRMLKLQESDGTPADVVEFTRGRIEGIDSARR